MQNAPLLVWEKLKCGTPVFPKKFRSKNKIQVVAPNHSSVFRTIKCKWSLSGLSKCRRSLSQKLNVPLLVKKIEMCPTPIPTLLSPDPSGRVKTYYLGNKYPVALSQFQQKGPWNYLNATNLSEVVEFIYFTNFRTCDTSNAR